MKRSDEIIEAALPYIDDVQAYRGFILGADWADNNPHWISAEAELPTHPEADSEDSERVLVHDGDEGYDIGYYSYKEQRWYTMHEDISVSYWMPLPRVPKGGEQ